MVDSLVYSVGVVRDTTRGEVTLLGGEALEPDWAHLAITTTKILGLVQSLGERHVLELKHVLDAPKRTNSLRSIFSFDRWQ